MQFAASRAKGYQAEGGRVKKKVAACPPSFSSRNPSPSMFV